jgi:hypothetical protein
VEPSKKFRKELGSSVLKLLEVAHHGAPAAGEEESVEHLEE